MFCTNQVVLLHTGLRERLNVTVWWTDSHSQKEQRLRFQPVSSIATPNTGQILTSSSLKGRDKLPSKLSYGISAGGLYDLVVPDFPRFTPEAKASRHPFVYIPFGAGPRNCVGMRLAQLEMKMALVRLFRRFNLLACTETKVSFQWFGKYLQSYSLMTVAHAVPCFCPFTLIFSPYICSISVQVPLELKSSSTLGPKNGVFVKIERRHWGESQVNSPSED